MSRSTNRSITIGRTPEWPRASDAMRTATTAADLLVAERRAGPAAVEAAEVDVQRLGQIGRHRRLTRFADAGGHPVDRLPRGELAFQAGAARLEPRAVLGFAFRSARARPAPAR